MDLYPELTKAVHTVVRKYEDDRADEEAKSYEKPKNRRVKNLGDGYTLRFDIKVDVMATTYGKDARITMGGRRGWFEVYSNAHKPKNTEWRVREHYYTDNGSLKDRVLWDLDSSDFDALIKHLINMLITEGFE